MKRVLTTILLLCWAVAISAQTDASAVELDRTTASDLQGRLKLSLEIPLGQKWMLTWNEEGA